MYDSQTEVTVEKPLTGAAGEYYVAFRLSALGYAIGLTPSALFSNLPYPHPDARLDSARDGVHVL